MSQVREYSAGTMAVRTATILFVFVVLFTGLLAVAYVTTKPSIEASAAEEKMKLIDEVLPRDRYDNDLLQDTLVLPPTPELGLDGASTVYRARHQGQPAAVVVEAVAPDGYAGKIRMIIAVGADGTISGVRVVQHKETPGLGDYIDPRKDKNKARPWIGQFAGLSFASHDAAQWKVKKEGGLFDSHVGATVSPRAVIKAVRKALAYVNAQHDTLFAVTGATP
jgi:Na+-translocating ferredoxin:NAD+ oxidoreductase subunit G